MAAVGAANDRWEHLIALGVVVNALLVVVIHGVAVVLVLVLVLVLVPALAAVRRKPVLRAAANLPAALGHSPCTRVQLEARTLPRARFCGRRRNGPRASMKATIVLLLLVVVVVLLLLLSVIVHTANNAGTGRKLSPHEPPRARKLVERLALTRWRPSWRIRLP